MTDTLTVPAAPPLSRIPGVELCQTGTWNLSTGPATFTPADFMAAVAALDCPAVRRPSLKLGHVPTVAGQAAVGYVDNLRADENWRTLVGDYAGMPGWFATPDADGNTVIASAFPDRSIEGAWDWRCQMGHTHPFVITAVSLLGAELPGVGTLASLQDVGRLYGVEGVPELVAASAEQDAHSATFTVPVTAAGRKDTMPNPTARTVAATVTSDDVRRAFYESPSGKSWDAWIEEVQLDPLQIIYIDDAEGARYRVEVTIGTGDGAEAVTFGEPVKVVIRYDDATVAAAAGTDVIRFASKAESRPGPAPRAAGATQTPASPPVAPSTNPEGADTMSDTLTTGLREKLGVNADLDEAGLLAALDEALAERATTPAAAATTPDIPEGKVLVSENVLEELRIAASAGAEARAVQLREQRDVTVAAAFRSGKISAARQEHWRTAWDKDPEGTAADLEALPERFPVAATTGYAGHDGSAGSAVTYTDDMASEDAELFGLPKEAFSR